MEIENELDSSYWEQRWRSGQTGWDAGQITTPIKDYVDQVQDKSAKILIPGAGNGYEVEYLHKSGFANLFVVDIAKTPLVNLKARLPDFPQSRLLHSDFFAIDGQYDLILEQTFFCSLQPSLRPEYVKKMNSLLKPGGKVAGVLFDTFYEATKPPFGATREEYVDYFSTDFDILVLEECRNSIAPRAGTELFFILQKPQNSST